MAMYTMSNKNVYVVSVRDYNPEFPSESFVIATYSNYESALAHAKSFVDDGAEVLKCNQITYVTGDYEATIQEFPLKEEFNNE